MFIIVNFGSYSSLGSIVMKHVKSFKYNFQKQFDIHKNVLISHKTKTIQVNKWNLTMFPTYRLEVASIFSGKIGTREVVRFL